MERVKQYIEKFIYSKLQEKRYLFLDKKLLFPNSLQYKLDFILYKKKLSIRNDNQEKMKERLLERMFRTNNPSKTIYIKHKAVIFVQYVWSLKYTIR